MRLILLILALSLPVLAITNYDVTVSKTGSVWITSPVVPSAGGLQDPSIIWVAQNSSSIDEIGTTTKPFKNLSVAAITASYGKVMIVCPGIYRMQNLVAVNSNMTIQSFSDNPNDTWITKTTAVPGSLFTVASDSKLYLRGIGITSSNTTSMAAINSPDRGNCEVINCVFESCVDSSFSIGNGVIFKKSRFYNNHSSNLMADNSDFTDCVITNYVVAAADGYSDFLLDCNVSRTTIIGGNSLYCSSDPYRMIWDNVTVIDVGIDNPSDKLFTPYMPSIMFNATVTGCRNSTGRSITDSASAIMQFGCTYENNNSDHIVGGVLSDPYTANGVSLMQFCTLRETNSALFLFQAGNTSGSILGCATNDIFHPVMFIDNFPH